MRPSDYCRIAARRLRKTLNKLLRGRIAALRGARSLAYLFDMPRSLRSARLALHPAHCFLQRFLSERYAVWVEPDRRTASV